MKLFLTAVKLFLTVSGRPHGNGLLQNASCKSPTGAVGSSLRTLHTQNGLKLQALMAWSTIILINKDKVADWTSPMLIPKVRPDFQVNVDIVLLSFCLKPSNSKELSLAAQAGCGNGSSLFTFGGKISGITQNSS